MTRIATKPDELPIAIDDLNPLAAPLVLDSRLSRQTLIAQIVAHAEADSGHDLDVDASTGHMTFEELSRVTPHIVPGENRAATVIHDDESKVGLARILGDHFGFDVDASQDGFRKSQLIHMVLTLATGTRPKPFTLPNDPDPSTPERFDNVAPTGAD
jgi:hypothetical protein